MDYQYRVYNSLTGHEYGDVDSYITAQALRHALAIAGTVIMNESTIDVLVAEVTA